MVCSLHRSGQGWGLSWQLALCVPRLNLSTSTMQNSQGICWYWHEAKWIFSCSCRYGWVPHWLWHSNTILRQVCQWDSISPCCPCHLHPVLVHLNMNCETAIRAAKLMLRLNAVIFCLQWGQLFLYGDFKCSSMQALHAEWCHSVLTGRFNNSLLKLHWNEHKKDKNRDIKRLFYIIAHTFVEEKIPCWKQSYEMDTLSKMLKHWKAIYPGKWHVQLKTTPPHTHAHTHAHLRWFVGTVS